MKVRPNFIPKALIVDDEPFNVEFLEIVLRQHGYEVISATNGRYARILAEQEKPDLILLDIMMPGENGFECAAALRLSPETCHIPIIFLSALDEATKISKGYDAGAVDFIVKPFEYKDVLHRIRLHLLIARGDCLQLCPESGGHADPVEEQFSSSSDSAAVFLSGQNIPQSFIHETVILPGNSEGHLLMNLDQPLPEAEKAVRALLAEYSGPLFTPSTTMRNIGMKIGRIIDEQNMPDGIFVSANRATETLTVVNAGALPVIYMQNGKAPTLIEPQSGPMGSLGLGLPPCATNRFKIRDRLFMFSRNMTSAFESRGKAIIDLCEACELSSGVDIETACLAAGEMLQKGKGPLNGVLIGIEG